MVELLMNGDRIVGRVFRRAIAILNWLTTVLSLVSGLNPGLTPVGNFWVNVFEVGRLPTSSGKVKITAPVGYTLSFASSLTSIQVSGAVPYQSITASGLSPIL